MKTIDNNSEKQKAVLGDLLNAAECAGIPIWFYGGYALDALEQITIREHKDIDVCVESKNRSKLVDQLVSSGFEVTGKGEDFVFLIKDNQGIELLTFEKWPDGQWVTNTGETGVFPWPENSFPDEPNGLLLGKSVRAMSYEGLYVCKAGYKCYDPNQQLREKDIADLELISSRIPPERVVELEAFFDPIPGTRKRYPNL